MKYLRKNFVIIGAIFVTHKMSQMGDIQRYPYVRILVSSIRTLHFFWTKASKNENFVDDWIEYLVNFQE